MTSKAKALYVYLQRPDTGDWVTVGRYLFDETSRIGKFRYANSYLQAGLCWSIDPVNLPLLSGSADIDYVAPRYSGLHDVLRDACPDAWGRAVIQREHGLGMNEHASRYLYLAGNDERWGALAVGVNKKPSPANLNSPRLPQLEALSRELLAMAAHRPALDARLRKRLVATPSLGGARPKATIQDGEHFWLVKPALPTDVADIPLLEHMAQQWGHAAGLHFAKTVHHKLGALAAAGATGASGLSGQAGASDELNESSAINETNEKNETSATNEYSAATQTLSVIRVQRFDRIHINQHPRRVMTLSAASLLQIEYPGAAHSADPPSYPRFADELRRIGAPLQDRIELFGRMVFNAIVGNDDDHPRNHAVLFDIGQNCWRLAPAFDVVPNPHETPQSLLLQLSAGRYDISRAAVLKDAARFGFLSESTAAAYLDELLQRIAQAFEQVVLWLPPLWQTVMRERLQLNLQRLQHERLQINTPPHSVVPVVLGGKPAA